MSTATAPRVHDNDRDEITVTLDGKEIRGWSYESEAERRVKMLAAREFCEGWSQARTDSPIAAIAETALRSIAAISVSDCAEYVRIADGIAIEAIAKLEAA